MGSRTVPMPQMQALNDMKRGRLADENLMNAAMMFNTLVRDGTAIECDDDETVAMKDYIDISVNISLRTCNSFYLPDLSRRCLLTLAWY